MMKKLAIAAILVTTGAIAAGSYIVEAKPGGPRGGMFGGGEIMFDRLDLNGDGSVTKEEIDQAKAERFALMDANGDGELTQTELEEGHQKLEEQRRAEHFARLDKDGDQTLSIDEFEFERGAEMFDRLDDNNDGAISKEEIEDMKGRFRKRFGKRGD